MHTRHDSRVRGRVLGKVVSVQVAPKGPCTNEDPRTPEASTAAMTFVVLPVS